MRYPIWRTTLSDLPGLRWRDAQADVVNPLAFLAVGISDSGVRPSQIIGAFVAWRTNLESRLKTWAILAATWLAELPGVTACPWRAMRTGSQSYTDAYQQRQSLPGWKSAPNGLLLGVLVIGTMTSHARNHVT